MINKAKKLKRRKLSIRRRIKGSGLRPRLAVYRSNVHIYCQLIDDIKMITLASANDLKIKKGTKIERAGIVGKQMAALAKKKKITKIVFDRSGRKFHGRVKALAEAIREGGIKF